MRVMNGHPQDVATGQVVGDPPNGPRIFKTLMDAARKWWPNKVAPELAQIFGVDVKSAERYLAGHRTPDAEKLCALINSDFGDRAITIIVDQMPYERQLRFWNGMADAARRRLLMAERERIDAEILRLSKRT